ncbi:hypothetical protein AALC25_00060 [Lachnospiraceae bacterium 29-84]
MGIIVFNGKSSKDYGIQVEHPPGYQTPARDYEMIHVPGRNGDILIDNGSFQNVDREYQIAVGSKGEDFTGMANKISEWLHSASGYARLEDSYEPEYYRMASCADGITVENLLRHAGRATLTFNCKPQRFLKSGEDGSFYHQEFPGVTLSFLYHERDMDPDTDFLEILYHDVNTNSLKSFGKFKGSLKDLSGIFIPNDTFYIFWHTDRGFNSEYGFKVKEVSPDAQYYPTRVFDGFFPSVRSVDWSFGGYPESPTKMAYRDNYNLLIRYISGIDLSSIPRKKTERIYNPTGFQALPLIMASGEGAGTVSINNYTVAISEVRGGIFIDSEIQDVYSGGGVNRNSDVILEEGFPKLNPGWNELSLSGDISSVEVVPRWWTL